MRIRTLAVALAACAVTAGPAAAHPARVVLPQRSEPVVAGSLKHDLVAGYGFERPVPGAAARERDEGPSGTTIDLVNGGPRMRVQDPAFPTSTFSMQTKQVNPTVAGNDDWKAGVFSESGVSTLHAFNAAREATVMGWVKMTGPNPNPNSTTADPDDYFNAVGLVGVLTGDSDGHAVRALLEIIDVDGTLRLVALGRRVDGASSQTFAADEDWRTLLPVGQWVFLTATFDYDNGTMALYRNGEPLSGFYTLTGDPWTVAGEPEPDLASATDPRGIKLGGSFPQNTLERNPCNCRMDGLLFLDRSASATEVHRQYEQALRTRPRMQTLRAGSAVKLGLRHGGRFTATSDRVSCATGQPLGAARPADRWWQTKRRWAGTCRELVARTGDGAVYAARLRFR
jgi:hypothetical protein